MRKYCRACGSSLIKPKDDSIIEPVEESKKEPAVETRSYSEDEPRFSPNVAASEQVEVENDPPEIYEEIEEAPDIEEMSAEPEEEISEPGPIDDERGREVLEDILEKVRAAEARTMAESETALSDTVLEPPPDEPLEMDEPLDYVEPTIELEEPFIEEEPEPVPEVVKFEEPSEVTSTSTSSEITDVPVRDEKVRIFESDITAYNIELAQLQSDFSTLRDHLDEEVETHRVVVEVKRTRTESIERELSLAKKEYNDANKEYNNVENRRKKELSNAEKRISEVEKRIKKAEESKIKRIEELEKERRKREEDERKD
ncbi:MAG: hypothetical protein E4H14_07665 [Candidatus Thorarchaeota archaeon]|nr:MAG: hypothetical protein E4H14_07665 [Candidatus Thorarchaeota archaeon]